MPASTLETILAGLMSRYEQRVPDVGSVKRIMADHHLLTAERPIQNDHIAFRTMGVPRLGIQSLEKIFLHCGYVRQDAYAFEKKQLDAYWYSPPEPHHPRVFISELRVPALSPEAQEIIHAYTDEVPADPVDQLDLDDGNAVDAFLHAPLWRTPTWSDYQTLAGESEYAAWVIYNRYYLNHFTISVHRLPEPYHTVAKFNELLESHGVRLNDAGGKIKTSKDGLLLQSSTVAEMVHAEFPPDDTSAEPQRHWIPGSYVEFAERRVDDYGRRRDGFEAGNADKIFESTFRNQTNRRS